jgi:AraC family ethanolamine operon transcriptional activator
MIRTLQTTDFDELTAAEEGWDIGHRPVSPEKFDARLTLASVGFVRVDVESWTTAVEIAGTSPPDALSIVLPFAETSSYLSSGMEVTANRIDVFGTGSEVYALMEPGAALIACSIPTESGGELLDSPTLRRLAEYRDGHRVVCSTPHAVVALRNLLKGLLRLSGHEELLKNAQIRLLDEVLLETSKALESGDGDSSVRPRRRFRLARRARDFMLERHRNPPTITKICDFLNTSERTLHYAFSEVYGVTPKRFLKTQRLCAAHKALVAASSETRVCDIALGLGFWDQSLFARDYRAMFGALPSATLRKHCNQTD